MDNNSSCIHIYVRGRTLGGYLRSTEEEIWLIYLVKVYGVPLKILER